MKNVTKILVLGLTLGASAPLLPAQDGPPPGDDRRPPARDGRSERPGRQDGDRPGPGGLRGQGPMNPIIVALDLNRDGVIDAEEINKASESLKSLDKNGDGKITREEFRPQRPGGPNGPRGPREDRPGRGRGGPGGPRGEGRPLPPPDKD